MADAGELATGTALELPGVPLRLSLTGVTAGARLQVVADDASEGAERRVSETELIVLPIGGKYRVEAVPAMGAAFAAGTRLGIHITTDSSSVESVQGFVQPRDVGALQGIALLELRFRRDEWTAAPASTPRRAEPVVTIDDAAHPWVGPGRFALRQAISEGARIPTARADGWGLVVDSSSSMRRSYGEQQLADLVQVVAGIFGEWTGRPPAATYTTGLVEPVLVAGDGADPTAVAAASYAATQPATWSIVTPAVRASVRGVDGAGAVVVITDGVPGDVADLVALGEEEPDLAIYLVTSGISRFGLPTDQADREPWQEELGGLEPAAGLPNVGIAALAPGVDLDERRSAELAAILLEEGA